MLATFGGHHEFCLTHLMGIANKMLSANPRKKNEQCYLQTPWFWTFCWDMSQVTYRLLSSQPFFLFHCLQLISQTNLDLISMLKAKKYMIWSPMTFNLALGIIILSEYNLMQLSSYRQSEQAIFSQFALYALQTNMFEFVDFVLVFSCKL